MVAEQEHAEAPRENARSAPITVVQSFDSGSWELPFKNVLVRAFGAQEIQELSREGIRSRTRVPFGDLRGRLRQAGRHPPANAAPAARHDRHPPAQAKVHQLAPNDWPWSPSQGPARSRQRTASAAVSGPPPAGAGAAARRHLPADARRCPCRTTPRPRQARAERTGTPHRSNFPPQPDALGTPADPPRPPT